MAIKVIVELQAKPGKRAALKCLLESMVANQGASQRGFLGSTRYEVLDNPDMLIEIAEWIASGAQPVVTTGDRPCRTLPLEVRLHAVGRAWALLLRGGMRPYCLDRADRV